MNEVFLKKFFEAVILSNYEQIDIDEISWKHYKKINSDAWTHYFNDKSGNEYVLLFEDYPSNSFSDNKSMYEVVRHGDDDSMRFGSNVPFKYVENITGYFTLFREK
jgi:hypothetical protein